jgi:predicted phosphoribosyltransferase
MFADRNNAGFKLVEELRKLSIKNPIILAIPDGGIETALPIVECQNAEFDLIILEKLRIPNKPEWSFSAITEDGTVAFNDYEKFVNHDEKKSLIADAKQRLEKRIQQFRSNEIKLDISGRNIIIVDDGANHGATLQACINSCKKQKVKSITIAIPVLSSKVLEDLKPRVNNLVSLFSSTEFKGINHYYRNSKTLDKSLLEERLKVLMSYKTQREALLV